MIQPTTALCIASTNLNSSVAKVQLEEALLSTEKRQSEGEVWPIIWAVEVEVKVPMDSDRETVAIGILKRLKSLKADTAKGTCASALLNIALDGAWTIAIPEGEEAAEEAAKDTDSDKETIMR